MAARGKAKMKGTLQEQSRAEREIRTTPAQACSRRQQQQQLHHHDGVAAAFRTGQF